MLKRRALAGACAALAGLALPAQAAWAGDIRIDADRVDRALEVLLGFRHRSTRDHASDEDAGTLAVLPLNRQAALEANGPTRGSHQKD